MKRFLLVLLAVSAFANQGNVVAQDIHQPSTLVLPVSPATSYIIEPGQNVKISSSTAVVLTDGVHFKQGSTVRVFIGNTPIVVPAPNNPALNLDMNWTSTKSYDENGNIIGENKSFFDDRGVPLQSQVKSISTGHVLASQSLYDIHGKPVISTLAAPINNSGFSYKPDFVTNPAGGKYSYTNFDGIKANSPDPLGQSAIGSLGWYYSNNNSFEAYVPATSYPYSRTAYYNDGTNSIKNDASIGDELRMGKGHETWGGSFPVLNELDVYSAIRAKYFAEEVIGDGNSLKSKSTQSFAVDENGNIGVRLSDLSGKVLMSARADDNGILSINNSTKINAVVSEYNFSVTTAGLIMGGSDPNAGGYGGGPSTFGIGSKYNVKVYRNGSLVYDGIGNDFVYSQLSLNSVQYVIKSSNPFTVSHSDGCSDCRAKIAESELSSIHYFQLFQASNVAITGNYELYDMKTESQISVGLLQKGYYKVRALEGDVNISYTNKVSDISFVFYNQVGQAIGNIAPEGVKLLLANGLDAYPAWVNVPFAETNEYDIKGNLISKTTVDAGKTEFIHREDGRIRFSQNTEQRKVGKFSYTNYDTFARIFESGEYLPGGVSFLAAKNNKQLLESTALDGGLVGGARQNQVFIHYDFPNQNHGLVNYIQDEFFLRSRISWSENNNSKTWYNYDEKGRVKWLVKDVKGIGVKTIDYSYSGSGNVEAVDYQRGSQSERFVHHCVYDADSRLSALYTSRDGVNKIQQAQYYYYIHGPLKRMELADNLQGIDYTYTAQGMLKSINHPDGAIDPGRDGTQNSFAPDVFAMTLEYFNEDYQRDGTGINSINPNLGKTWYNGNITAQSWKTTKPSAIVNTYGAVINSPKMFTYNYDDRNQFNSNKFGKPDFTNRSFSEEVNINREHGITYDANGNIKHLTRTDAAGGQLNLDYHYANNNKLQSVDNYASYVYDDLGQMISQHRANGQNYYLLYNVGGKVEAIYSDANRTQLRVSYLYDEQGKRVKKIDHLQNIETYYVYDALGNVLAVYDNNGTGVLPKEMPIYAAGRIGTFNMADNNYQYELTDNLGNVRAIVNGNKISSGQADVVYYSDYYPFGSALTLANNTYRYGYQGKFAEVDKETGWNNFDFRMYDSQIARWMSTDPYREHWSPYLAMGNNPVMTVDPDGGCTKCPKKAKIGDVYKVGDATYTNMKDGGWTRTGLDLGEVNVNASPVGFYKSFFKMGTYGNDSYQRNTAFAYLMNSGYNYQDENWDLKANWSVGHLTATNYTGSGKHNLALHAEAKGSVLQASISAKQGDEKFGSISELSGKVLSAEAEETFGILTGEGSKYGVMAGVKAGASVASYEYTGGIKIFGVTVSFQKGNSYMSAEVSAGGGVYYDSGNGVTTIKGFAGLGWGFGARYGLTVAY